jgi:hypothetical protein
LQYQNNELQRETKQEEQGFRMGIEMSKHREQLENQRRQSDRQNQLTKKGD